MKIDATSSGERVHIAFFGLRNAGKSSLVNAVTGQELSVVSEVKGTTTDPVKKAMELLPIGPVVIIDTPGIDDEGELGTMRVKKAKQTLSHTDIAILVHDASSQMTDLENELLKLFNEKNIPYIVALNKADLIDNITATTENEIVVSAKYNINIEKLKEKIGALCKDKGEEKRIIGDLLNKKDTVVLVMPMDLSAPKGRIILPQQQTLRDILDSGCSAICCQDTELSETINNLKTPPKMVITDSKVFDKVSKIVPKDILLTSFSILFARYKGDLMLLTKGAKKISSLKDGDYVLVSEGCTHHRQCGDIGAVKMPMWIRNFSKAEPTFEFTSGGDFPEDLSKYSLIIHCGGCMLNEREMKSRIEKAVESEVDIVNYGIAISYMNKILSRSLEPFPEILKILDE